MLAEERGLETGMCAPLRSYEVVARGVVLTRATFRVSARIFIPRASQPETRFERPFPRSLLRPWLLQTGFRLGSTHARHIACRPHARRKASCSRCAASFE